MSGWHAAPSQSEPAVDGAIELPWAMLPFAEAMPHIPEAADFVRSYGRAVHLHDLIMRLEAVSPDEARRLLMQNLVSLDGQVVQAWTADIKPGARLQIRKSAYRVGPMEGS